MHKSKISQHVVHLSTTVQCVYCICIFYILYWYIHDMYIYLYKSVCISYMGMYLYVHLTSYTIRVCQCLCLWLRILHIRPFHATCVDRLLAGQRQVGLGDDGATTPWQWSGSALKRSGLKCWSTWSLSCYKWWVQYMSITSKDLRIASSTNCIESEWWNTSTIAMPHRWHPAAGSLEAKRCPSCRRHGQGVGLWQTPFFCRSGMNTGCTCQCVTRSWHKSWMK